MGIPNLLKSLRDIQQNTHISEFKGKKLGIDGHVWLHTACLSCATDLALGKPTTKYLSYCISRLRIITMHGVIPVVVFDGDLLPMKKATADKRKELREKYKQEGMAFLNKNDRKNATKCFQKSIQITPQIVKVFIDHLRSHNLEFVVAPYEADAQLVYLENKGLISAIHTIDSDLLVFGAKTVIYKLENDGECLVIKRQDLGKSNFLKMINFTFQDFVNVCILAGCDYLDSVPNIGLQRALKYYSVSKTIPDALKRMQFDGYRVPLNYKEQFEKALLTFKHQRVYCPNQKKMVFLSPAVDLDDDFVGGFLSDDVVCGVAEGHLNPKTKAPFCIFKRKRSPLREKCNQDRTIIVEGIAKRFNSFENRVVSKYFLGMGPSRKLT